MKQKTRKRPVFQVILKHGRDYKLEKIAAYRGQTKSAVITTYIDNTYPRLPVEAQ